MARNLMSVFNQRPSEDPFVTPPTAAPAAPTEMRAPYESQETSPRGAIKLGKTLVFKGELSVGEDVLLLGRVEGSFAHSESLTVGVGGVIVGDVSGRALIVKGTVEGDIDCTESVVLMPGSCVTGDITSPRVNIVEGSKFNGSVKMVTIAEQPKHDYKLGTDGSLTDEAVDQLLSLLNERKKAGQ